MKNKKKKMDARCPRMLDTLPCEFCPLAVLRLKALRNTEKELSEEEEARLPGCPWSINHQMSNYCFFSYVANYLHQPPSDKEIAHMSNVSIETVKEVADDAMIKIREMKVIKDLADE
jgi:hypothetical protein